MLLIFTHRRGFEADAVIDELRRRSVSFLRFNTDDPAARVAFDPSALEASYVTCDNRTVAVSDLHSGWFQQEIPSLALTTDATRQDRLAEATRTAVAEFLVLQPHIAWLSTPGAIRRAANKPRQLQLALEAGLRIPRTCVTNDPAAVAELDLPGREGLIVKNLATPTFRESGELSLAYTSDLDLSAVSAEQIQFAPLIYQERLPRVRDIRVVMVGEDIYSASIYSSGLTDIRRVPMKEAEYTPYELDRVIGNRLRILCDALELGYASIDLAETRNGDVYFLEANATGAFLWVEKMCGFAIARAIADRLGAMTRG